MYLGSMVEMAPAGELYAHHAHPYTKALLSALPIPDPEVEEKRHRIVLSGDVPSPVNLGAGCPFRKRCPHATEECARVKPMLREIAPDHFVACHRV